MACIYIPFIKPHELSTAQVASSSLWICILCVHPHLELRVRGQVPAACELAVLLPSWAGGSLALPAPSSPGCPCAATCFWEACRKLIVDGTSTTPPGLVSDQPVFSEAFKMSKAQLHDPCFFRKAG